MTSQAACDTVPVCPKLSGVRSPLRPVQGRVPWEGLRPLWFVLSWLCISPCDRRALGEQNDKDHWPLRAGETPYGTQIPQQQHLVGDVRQQILVGQIRAKQEAEQEQLHTGLRVEDGRSLLAVPISVPPSLLCSLLCSFCDMMESRVFGVLSPLLETRGS